MAIHRRGVIGLGVAGAALAAGLARAQPGPALVGGSPAIQAAVEDIGRYATLHLAAYGLPGMILALTAPDGATATLALGWSEPEQVRVAPDQLFQVGSISKSFTALCVYQLVDAGKLSLSSDVRTLLPEVPWPDGAPVTVQQLLNHSSGLPDDAPMVPQGPQRLWRGFEPGTRWSYSNLGFALLSTLVERIEGRPYPAVLQARVLDPLNMRQTRPAILNADRALYAQGYAPLYADRPTPLISPLGPAAWTEMQEGSGCVASTAADMALYLRYLIAAGQGRGAPLLSDKAARAFTTATVAAPDWSGPDAHYANGLAVVTLNKHAVLQHTGGMLGFNSCLHVDPAAGVGAFASTNVGMIDYRPRDVTAYAVLRLRAALEGGPAPMAEPAPPKAPPATPYAGRYVSRAGRGLEVAAGGTRVLVDGQALLDVEVLEENMLVARDPARTPFAFVFRLAGDKVVRLWWGGEEFVRVGAKGPAAAFTAASPPQIARLTGHYGSNDPWLGDIRVTAQGDQLFLFDMVPLSPLGGDLYRVGAKDWLPERLLFDAALDGRPMRAISSGAVRTRQSV